MSNKVFTHRPVVDLCACSPRDYTTMAHRKQLARDTHNKDPRTVVDGMSVLELLNLVRFYSCLVPRPLHKRLGVRPEPLLQAAIVDIFCIKFTHNTVKTILCFPVFQLQPRHNHNTCISAELAAVAADSKAELKSFVLLQIERTGIEDGRTMAGDWLLTE